MVTCRAPCGEVVALKSVFLFRSIEHCIRSLRRGGLAASPSGPHLHTSQPCTDQRDSKWMVTETSPFSPFTCLFHGARAAWMKEGCGCSQMCESSIDK
jgi:hypothetical protein